MNGKCVKAFYYFAPIQSKSSKCFYSKASGFTVFPYRGATSYKMILKDIYANICSQC